jgi:hypothetical protein
MAADSVQAVEPADGDREGTADKGGSEARAADADLGSVVEAVHESVPKSPNASKATRRPWRQWGAKFWVGAAAIVTGAIGIWLAGWLGFLAGPPAAVAPSAKPIVNPGHLPGRLDVSAMSPGRRFYALPNFYEFQSCGRPCWLPLYQLPTEQSAFVTDGWPCEYYEPNSTSNGPFCLQPPSRRTPSERADPAVRNSGDRVLVVCQVTQISKGQAAPTIRNQVGKSSNIWDMVAVPGSYISRDSAAAGRLSLVPGMPGFYEAFGPDIWLGNTGWHGIPCK